MGGAHQFGHGGIDPVAWRRGQYGATRLSQPHPGATDDDAQRLNRVIRTHWEIENRVHWVLDVARGEDVNRTRKGESAQNLALIRKLALT